jgi:DnaJ like chaperone protein
MSAVEIFVVVLGLYGGYWIISQLLSAKLETQKQTASEKKTVSEDGKPIPWYVILNVSPDSSVEEIRHNYKILMSQYHPDKVASLGDELKALAERRSQEIAIAYRSAIQLRGISNDT